MGALVATKVYATSVKLALTAIGNRAGDLTRVFKGPVDKVVRDFYDRQFKTEGRAGKRQWKQLSPRTLAFKARHRRQRMGILRFTNRLYRSYVNRSGPDSLLVVEPRAYERSSLVPYARQHQLGTRWMPARQVPVDPLPVGVERAITNAIAVFVATGQFQYGVKL